MQDGGKHVTVGIVDDHPVVAMGLSLFFKKENKPIVVIWASDNLTDAKRNIREHPVDLLVVDLQISGESGFDLLEAFPGLPMVIYTNFYNENYIRRAFTLGALGFVQKADPLDRLAEAIQEIAQGRRVLTVRDRDLLGNRHKLGLSRREAEVLELIHGGLSNKQIGEELQVAESTVKSHVKSIFFKLGVQSRQQASRAAIDLGILLPQ